MITQKGNKNMLFTLFLDGEEYGERIDSRFLGVFSSFPAVIAHVSSRLMYQGLRWEDYPFRLCHEFNYIFSPGQEELVRRGEKDQWMEEVIPDPEGFYGAWSCFAHSSRIPLYRHYIKREDAQEHKNYEMKLHNAVFTVVLTTVDPTW